MGRTDSMAALGGFGFLIFIGVGIAQAYVGFLGIEYHFGEVWGWVAIGAAFILRIMFPLTIATYFGAVDVLGWPWYGALALTAPGLLFAAPAMITAVLGTVLSKDKDAKSTIIDHDDRT